MYGDSPEDEAIEAHLTEENKTFFSNLQNNDDLAAVLRAQMHIEAKFDELMTMSADITHIYSRKKVRFTDPISARLKWACAFGVISCETHDMILAVNELRNSFGHKLTKALGQDDYIKLRDSLTEYALHNYLGIHWDDDDQSPRTQIRMMLAVILWDVDLAVRRKRWQLQKDGLSA